VVVGEGGFLPGAGTLFGKNSPVGREPAFWTFPRLNDPRGPELRQVAHSGSCSKIGLWRIQWRGAPKGRSPLAQNHQRTLSLTKTCGWISCIGNFGLGSLEEIGPLHRRAPRRPW